MAGKSIRFVGEAGESHFGIPARDLAPEEFAALTDEQQALVRVSRLYEVPSASVKAAESAEAAPKA